ncbi:MAG: MBOAT family protein [Clostridia bacterium]|nr:MBOAT family protein [Clostridia bacterium]
MVFSSLLFVCLFMPVVFLLQLVVKNLKVKNALLLIASLLFYAYGEPTYIFLMLFSCLLNYVFALLLSEKKSKFFIALAVIMNLALLGIFKYTGFLLTSLNDIVSLNLTVPEIPLPIGISFFTFQALTYVIDVYRGDVGVQKNYGKVLLYVSFFPQLIAGPIVRYKDIAREIDERHASVDDIACGLRRFIAGLGKKVLISNTMAMAVDFVFGISTEDLNIASAWIGALAYIMQIYFDFSGYSDMAIGLGRMFGFHFKENFNYPYIATSMQDFWRRWHISLSTFFRDYVYIPLGGNRKGRLRTVLNKVIVFFLTGLWHGANWTFVVWGLFHGFFLLLEEFIPRLKKLPKVISHIYTLLAVTVGFVIFRADTLGQGVMFVGKMFSGFNFSAEANSLTVQTLTPFFIVMFVAAVIGCGPLSKYVDKIKHLEITPDSTKKQKCIYVVSFVLAVIVLIWCILRLAGGSYNPFIYFRF